MTNKNIEDQIKQEIESQTPDNFSAIASACKNTDKKGKIITMKKNRLSLIAKISAVAAVFVMLLAVSVGIYTSATSVDAIISLDVNPGVEITLGKNQKVRALTATNDDGEAIITDLDVKGKTLDEALDILMDKFVEGGYISESSNSLLVSVNAKKLKNTDEISAQITERINTKLSESGVEASILTQVVSEKDEIKALAEEYKMSVGKARLVYELVQKDGRHTFEELSSLTVHELHLLLKETNLIPEDIKSNGKINEEALISKEEALQIALESVELTKEEVTDVEIELDYIKNRDELKGIMVYDVEFENADTEYEIDVDAKTGEIIKSKNEPADEKKDNDKVKPEGEDYKAPQRPENLIGKEEAFKQAFENENFDEKDLGDIDFDVKLKDDKWQYEIEFEKDGDTHKVKIDAMTGEILSNEKKAKK